MLVTTLIIASILTALAAFLARGARASTRFASAGSTVTFLLSLMIGIPAIIGNAQVSGFSFWYVDALSGLMVLLVGTMQWTATLVSSAYLAEELSEGEIHESQVNRYFALLHLFVFSMLLTAVSNNLGVMWVALEATTLTTTLLVAFYAREGSLEAAWKYLILCSTGITLGLLGLMVTYYGAVSGGALHGMSGMQWTDLSAAAHLFSPKLLKIAFAFVLIGFGTKVGIVPMHTWLPDAHSRAPAPISALLSGVLLNAALFAVLRYRALVDGALGSTTWTSMLFLALGALTVAVPAAFIIAQRDYKRFLAYSSIEHMGLIVFSLGLGAVGAVAAVIHMAGHALLKSMLFFGAGNILLRFKSTKFENVAGVMRTLPYTGGFFLAGTFLLLAAPPSPLFLSEYLIVSRAIMAHPYLTLVVLIALAVIAAGFLRFLMPLLFGAPKEGHEPVEGETWNRSHSAMLVHLLLVLVFGMLVWNSGVYALVGHVASVIG